MRKTILFCFLLGLAGSPLLAQEDFEPEARPKGEKGEKARPPRIPDGPFVPKRGMLKREKGQFWAGPPDEGRFGQILSLTLVPSDRLHEKLAEWPNYQELSPQQKERLAERIEQVRETARRQALEVAKEFNLQVSAGREDEFVRMYWTERVRMDQILQQDLLTKRKRLEQESEERILRKFTKDIKN